MHYIFLQNVKTSDYARNSAPIDGAYIIISVADVSREFRFMLDTKFLQIPTTLNQFNSGLYEYLWHVSNKYKFATSILHIIVEEQLTVHI